MLGHLRRLAGRCGLTACRCPLCEALTDAGRALCPDCEAGLRPRTGGLCPACGTMSGDSTAPVSLCGACRLDPPPWGRLIFHGAYAGTLRECILAYKFHGGLHRTRLLGDFACQAFARSGADRPELVVPVPLHTRRLLRRGFNQSTELARALGQSLERPVCNRGLLRIRHTRPQTCLDATERRVNIKDAFRADPDRVGGRRVLLVDDVYTTGATLSECTRTLKRAGCAGVDVLVLARAGEGYS